jgi:hypothetical protein
MLRNAIFAAARPLLSQSVCGLFFIYISFLILLFSETRYHGFWSRQCRPESTFCYFFFICTISHLSTQPTTKYGGIYTVGCSICVFFNTDFTRLGNPHTWGRHWNRNYRLRERDLRPYKRSDRVGAV